MATPIHGRALTRVRFCPSKGMSFSEHLQSIVKQVDGALVCSVMGFDGISIETCRSENTALNMDVVWVEFANVLLQWKHTVDALKTGKLVEACVHTTDAIAVMRLVTPEYFLALSLLPSGNYGKARYILRLKASEVGMEL